MDNLKFLNYRVISLIGEGGMGKVYLAEDEMLDKRVALKVLNLELSQEPQFIDRFKQEAKIQSILVHPHIITLHNLLVDNNRYFIVMEYAEGITLKELIQKTGPINESRALKIFAQTLDAVGYAHSRNIIHRDIKPSNIMVSLNDDVKIMDFGIAKLLGERSLTGTGAKVGTLYYMSPEQIEKPKDIDYKTDLYSLGIVLFEMVTGNLPFNIDTESDFKLMNEIVNAPLPDPRKYYPHISDKTIELISTLTQKDKNLRFANCAQTLNFVKYGKTIDDRIFKQEASVPAEEKTALTPPPITPPEKTQIAPNFEAQKMVYQKPLAKQPVTNPNTPLQQSIPDHKILQKPLDSQNISNIPVANKSKGSKSVVFIIIGALLFIVIIAAIIKFVILADNEKPIESKTISVNPVAPDSIKIKESLKTYLINLYSKKDVNESPVKKDVKFEFNYTQTDKFDADKYNPYSSVYITGNDILLFSNFNFISFLENKFSGSYELKNDEWDINANISGSFANDKVSITEINYISVLYSGIVPDEINSTIEKNTSLKNVKPKPNVNKTTRTTTTEKPKVNPDIGNKPKVRDPH
ncbi:MAG TPA: protein kinase [Ignavibacteria bacterium]